MDSESLIAVLTPNARAWISEQRAAHRASSIMLSDSLRGTMAPYFDAVTLQRARIRLVPFIQNPPFYDALLANADSVPLIDFTEMAGITLDDTILVSAKHISGVDSTALIFHELVHVAQYARLGVAEFAIRYVRGWVENGMQYAAIRLERDAYELQDRFERREAPFSVEAEVARLLSESGPAA